MSLAYNGTEVQSVTYNGAEVQSITMDGVEVWSAIKPNLEDNTPAQIKRAIQQGIAANLWDVGDEVGIVLNGTVGKVTFNNETFCATILGFDHNKDVESGGAHNVHFIFGRSSREISDSSLREICFTDSGYGLSQDGANYFHHHTSDTNTNGWSGSDLRTMCSAFLGCMPAEWQAVIGSSTKYSDNHGGGSDTASYVTATQDKVFLLAEWEVEGTRLYANSAEQNYQQQYDYYKNGSSKLRYRTDVMHYESAYWWLRSVSASNSDGFCNVCKAGANSYRIPRPARMSLGFSPGFAIF